MHQCRLHRLSGFELLDVSGPASVFNGANRALGQQDKPPFYEVELASAEGGAIESSSGVALETRPIAELRPGTAQDGSGRRGGTRATPAGRGGSSPPGSPSRTGREGRALRLRLHAAASSWPRSDCSTAIAVATHWDSCKPLHEHLSEGHGRSRRALRGRRAALDIGRGDHRHRHGAGDDRPRPRCNDRRRSREKAGPLCPAARLPVPVQPGPAGAGEGRQPVCRPDRVDAVESRRAAGRAVAGRPRRADRTHLSSQILWRRPERRRRGSSRSLGSTRRACCCRAGSR